MADFQSREAASDAVPDAASISAECPDSAPAVRLLNRYYDELGQRDFDPGETIPVPSSELIAPHGGFLVVRVGEHAVGCGAVRTLDEETAEIKRMWVDPAYRGHALGRRLVHALEAQAAALGARIVRLDTSDQLTEALRLYRASGYTEIPAYNDNPDASHWFEKRLREDDAIG